MDSFRRLARGALCGLGASLVSLLPIGGAHVAQAPLPRFAGIHEVRFDANEGQWADGSLFHAHAGGLGVALTDRGFVLALNDGSKQSFVRVRSRGGHPATVAGEDIFATRASYFHGNDPSRWRTRVPSFARVRQTQIAPGVNATWHGENGNVEYDLDVDASLEAPIFDVDGAKSLAIADDGSLTIDTDRGAVLQRIPKVVAYDASGEHVLAARHRLVGPTSFTIDVPDRSHGERLLVDPTLVFATYLGGTGNDVIGSIVRDASGAFWVAGRSDSSDYPTNDAPYPTSAGSSDMVVSHLSGDGSSLLESTYIGGSGFEGASSVTLDTSNHVIVAGWSYSTDFPMVNALQPAPGGDADAILLSLPTAGGPPVFSTYFGGSGEEDGTRVAVDPAGALILCGTSESTDLPIKAALQATAGGNGDVFVARLTADGSSLVSSTYLGGISFDSLSAVAIDPSDGSVFLGGGTGDDFPIKNSIQPSAGAGDGFLVKLDSSLAAMIYGSYVGGSSFDQIAALALSKSGGVFFGGGTQSSDFPTVRALFPTYAGEYGSAFAARMNAAGTALEFSTYLPGSVVQDVEGVTVDADGTPYFVGATESSNFPVLDPVMSPPVGDLTAFLTVLTPNGSELVMSTLFGAQGMLSRFAAVDVNDAKRATMVGWTTATTGITTPGAFQTTYPGLNSTDTSIVVQIADFPLAIEPLDASVPPRGAVPFVGAGGQGAFHFSLATNASGATIDAVTGLYTAGPIGHSTDVARVTDDTGAHREATVHTGDAISVAPDLAHSPTRGSVSFTATGGSGKNYVWSLSGNASGGTIDSAGTYTAGSTGSVIDHIDVQDDLGNHGSASVDVAAAISISPTSATVAPLDTRMFSATGGTSGGYVWSLSINASGASIDPTRGLYAAGATAKVQDEIAVVDSLGNRAVTKVFVGNGIDIEPKEANVGENGTLHFVSTGGTETGLVFSILKDESGGTITPDGIYTAGSKGASTDTIQVVDSVGNRTTTNVHIESTPLAAGGAGCSCREAQKRYNGLPRAQFLSVLGLLASIRARRRSRGKRN